MCIKHTLPKIKPKLIVEFCYNCAHIHVIEHWTASLKITLYMSILAHTLGTFAYTAMINDVTNYAILYGFGKYIRYGG